MSSVEEFDRALLWILGSIAGAVALGIILLIATAPAWKEVRIAGSCTQDTGDKITFDAFSHYTRNGGFRQDLHPAEQTVRVNTEGRILEIFRDGKVTRLTGVTCNYTLRYVEIEKS